MAIDWIALEKSITLAGTLLGALTRNDAILSVIGKNRGDNAKRLAAEAEDHRLTERDRDRKRTMALTELEGAYGALLGTLNGSWLRRQFTVNSATHADAAQVAVALAISYEAVGDLHSSRVNLERARRHFDQYVETREREEVDIGFALELPTPADTDRSARERESFERSLAKIA